MLSTKNISTESSRTSKNLNPGTQAVKINSISLAKGYELDSLRVILDLEGPDMGEDFEGFPVTFGDNIGPKSKGQVGKVRMSQFDYKDGVTKSGRPVKRDQGILQSLMVLSKALGKDEELNKVEADTIEEFVEEANTVLSGDTYINIVLGGKAYIKNGYTKYDLFIPFGKDGKFSFEAIGVKDSNLMEFNPDVHIIKLKTEEVKSFEPTEQKNTSSFSL